MKFDPNYNTLFCDLDGVQADFDTMYQTNFGVDPRLEDDRVLWRNVAKHGSWFRDLPKMKDADVLWEGIKQYKPTILTGVPSNSPQYSQQKREWVTEHLGSDVIVVTCMSKDKSLFCKPGDILIDDWEKHKQKWIDKGGIWITHTSANNSLIELKRIMDA